MEHSKTIEQHDMTSVKLQSLNTLHIREISTNVYLNWDYVSKQYQQQYLIAKHRAFALVSLIACTLSSEHLMVQLDHPHWTCKLLI